MTSADFQASDCSAYNVCPTTAEARLEQLSHHFDPDRDDPGGFYEAADEV